MSLLENTFISLNTRIIIKMYIPVNVAVVSNPGMFRKKVVLLGGGKNKQFCIRTFSKI